VAEPPLPLAAASERLHGKPGRPRTRPILPARQALELAAVTALPARLLSVAGAAEYLGISDDSVRNMIAGGHLPAVRLPGCERRVLLDRAALDRLVDTSTSD
jgi:excisionase family DNA binding protein